HGSDADGGLRRLVPDAFQRATVVRRRRRHLHLRWALSGGEPVGLPQACPPAGRYSGGYPRRRREDPIPALWRWPRRRGFTRRVVPRRRARSQPSLAPAPHATSTSSSASRLGPSIMAARVAPSL